MNYAEYVKYQVEGPGMIKKPFRYRDGERRAIDWFFSGVNRNYSVLDVGCGTGVGMRHLKKLGFTNIRGIELNNRKVEICMRRGLDVFRGDVEHILFPEKYDVIWASHSFEHMLHPDTVLKKLMSLQTKPLAYFFFVLPYPDKTPAIPHCASVELGLDIDDGGRYVTSWFTSRGLRLLERRMDDYREPEIWLRTEKLL